MQQTEQAGIPGSGVSFLLFWQSRGPLRGILGVVLSVWALSLRGPLLSRLGVYIALGTISRCEPKETEMREPE